GRRPAAAEHRAQVIGREIRLVVQVATIDLRHLAELLVHRHAAEEIGDALGDGGGGILVDGLGVDAHRAILSWCRARARGAVGVVPRFRSSSSSSVWRKPLAQSRYP